MAVTGLNNLSSLRSSFFGEPQSSPSSWWGEQQDRSSTRASSLLQIWRELEGEDMNHLHKPRRQSSDISDSDGLSTFTLDGKGTNDRGCISEAAGEIENQRCGGSESEQEDCNSTISEQSADLGEVERERVRQIFRDWMKGGAKNHSYNGPHRNNRSRPQWPGENECESVRAVREWVQANTQHGGSCGEPTGGVGFQTEQIHDAVALRRPIRRLCGRQTLLDLLLRAQRQRKCELLDLSERRPVSGFAYRNRIQALLRGSFLRSQRLIQDTRPSVATSELGLLRQRHTVSDLREGFLSRFDSSAHIEVNRSQFDVSFSNESNVQRDEQLQSEKESKGTVENTSQPESDVQVAEMEEPDSGSVENIQEVSSNVEYARENDVTRTWEENIAKGLSCQAEEIDSSEQREIFHEQDEPRNEASYVNELVENTYNMVQNMDDEFITGHLEFDSQDASAQGDEMQESVIEFEESDWQHVTNGTFGDWLNGLRDDMDRGWEVTTANQWFHETSSIEVIEPDQIHELHENWQGQDLQEAIDSWLDMPSGEESSILRFGSYNFSEDENVYSMELRELFTRRRVSSLLRSGFRESLNQVLQSHVERQGHVSRNWELGNRPPDLPSEDQEQPNGDQDAVLLDGAEENPVISPSSLVFASQLLWDEEFRVANEPPGSHQRLGIEWQVINDLRMDMARLQQMMNNMQSMLEACMDMQTELQLTVRQELSAALNRSVASTDTGRGNWLKDDSQWDHVRKGICCLCYDTKIDSLLYRCGHMCTCSKCADKLVHETGSCPMCEAPVVEAVRAYFVQET